jgi:hypothetical protein
VFTAAYVGSLLLTLYSTLWFLRNGRFDFSGLPRIGAWMERMGAFGHGQREDFNAEGALDVAQAAAPTALPDDSVSPLFAPDADIALKSVF